MLTLLPQWDGSMRKHYKPEALLALTVVWDHHGEWAEESLQVVGELSAAGVARVHGDEDGTCPDELDLSTLKHEPLHLMRWVGRGGGAVHQSMHYHKLVDITGVTHNTKHKTP